MSVLFQDRQKTPARAAHYVLSPFVYHTSPLSTGGGLDPLFLSSLVDIVLLLWFKMVCWSHRIVPRFKYGIRPSKHNATCD
jgi:hypothetical protein